MLFWARSLISFAHMIGGALSRLHQGRRIEKVKNKTYIRIPKYPAPILDNALAECKADKSWRTFELSKSGHMAMLDAPERLTDLLLQAAY